MAAPDSTCERLPVTRPPRPSDVVSSKRLIVYGLCLRGFQALTSLGTVLVLARGLGPAGRGEYFLFVAAVAVLTRVADLGLSPAAVVYAARYPDARRQIHTSLVRVLVAASAVASVGLAIVLWVGTAAFARGAPVSGAWLMPIVLPLTLYEQLWTHLMVGMRRVTAMNIVQAVFGMVTLGLATVFVLRGSGGVSAAITVFVTVTAARALVMLSVALYLTRGSRPATPPLLSTRDIVRFGLRGYPNGLASLLWMRLPAFVLGWAEGPAAVGILSIGQQVFEQLLLPAQATQDAIYQRITWLPRDRATAAMNQYLRLGLWGMLCLGMICAVLAPWCVPLIFGPAFTRSTFVLEILLISSSVTVVPALLSPYFFGQLQRPGLASTLGWIRVLLALGLSVILAPRLAEIGVAAALAVADVCSTLLVLTLYVRMSATSVAQAVLPRTSDFGRVLRRTHV